MRGGLLRRLVGCILLRPLRCLLCLLRLLYFHCRRSCLLQRRPNAWRRQRHAVQRQPAGCMQGCRGVFRREGKARLRQRDQA